MRLKDNKVQYQGLIFYGLTNSLASVILDISTFTNLMLLKPFALKQQNKQQKETLLPVSRQYSFLCSYNLRYSVDFFFLKYNSVYVNSSLFSSFLIFLFSFNEQVIFSIRIVFPFLTGYLSTSSFIFLGEVSCSNRITRSNVLNN